MRELCIGANDWKGSKADEDWPSASRRLLGVEPTESARKQTSRLESLLTGEEQTIADLGLHSRL